MDPILHFAANSLTLAQVTYIHASSAGTAPYTFAHHVNAPNFALPAHFNFRTTRLRRYHLGKHCLRTPWQARKIGPLYTPWQLTTQDVKIHDYVALDIAHERKGMRGTSFLPPAWANPLVRFFQYYVNQARTKYYLETQETRTMLYNHLVIRFYEAQIATLYHALVCLVTKDFTDIIDMLKYPRFRTTQWQTFEDLRSLPLIKEANLKIPGTIEFVVELAFWAQNVGLLDDFAGQLNKHLEKNATNFKKDAREFLTQKDTLKKYMRRVLHFMKQT